MHFNFIFTLWLSELDIKNGSESLWVQVDCFQSRVATPLKEKKNGITVLYPGVALDIIFIFHQTGFIAM